MDETPTLPGTLPGLLQPGCPVVWLDCAHEPDPCRGWCVMTPDRTRFDAGSVPVVLVGDDDVCSIPISRVALDLSQPEGVDRALRWLAGRTQLPSESPVLGIMWYRQDYDYGGEWRLLRGGIEDRRWTLDTDDPVEALRLACLAVGEVSGG